MRFKAAVLPFVVGLLLGALVCALFQPVLSRRFGWGHRRPDAEQVTERIARRLSLTPDQKARVRRIMDDSFQKMKDLRDQVRPRFKEIRESARKDIRAILNPEQQAKFDKIAAEHERRMEKMRAKFGDR